MKNSKNRKWFVFGLIVFLLAVLILLIVLSKNAADSTSLSLAEKKWIENNKKDVINVSIVNDLPVFSLDGEGVFFDFIDGVSDKTGLSFNEVSYGSSDDVLENDVYFSIVRQDKIDELSDKDMVFYKDYYILIGKKDEQYTDVLEIKNKKIGTLSDDLSSVSYYLPSNGVNTFTPYNSKQDLDNALENGSVDYIAVPKMRYVQSILQNKYHVVYNLTEVKEAYVLNVGKNSNKNLKGIITKNYKDYKKNKLDADYNSTLMTLFINEKQVSEKYKADFLSKKYVYGYVDNEPYSGMVNNRLIGFDSTYLDSFSNLTGASFNYKRYRSVSDLTKALNKGEVDVASNYYNYSGLSGSFTNTNSPYLEEYVILVHNSKTDLIVNSIKSLKDKKVVTTNSSIVKYLKSFDVKVTTYDKVSALSSKINKSSIIVLDSNVYRNYKDSDFSDYHVIYSSKAGLNYGFIINTTDTNNTFASLFTSYIEIVNHKQINNLAWKSYAKDSKELSMVYFYVIGVVILAIILLILFRKKIKVKRKVKKEETIRYVDPLTSLKNRNYLNKNFKKWEANAIYPQAIIVINLNNLRHINDVYGHEEGDKLIKLAANVLIRNQLEQSDIIRTDGNEYMIYMVGYEENKVIAYVRKLYKEFKELPYGFGATLGYSMIEDDIKTIDDAINEAVLEIRTNREMNNKDK